MRAPRLTSLGLLPLLIDPAPGPFRTKEAARRLQCERITVEAATQKYPGQVVAARPRGDFTERSVVYCTQQLMRPGLRSPRDEAVLSNLQERSSEIASSAAANHPELASHTWLVDTFYPSAFLSSKVSFATKNALMAQGLSVSDRTPVLSAGDVNVITRMNPMMAYPVACKRYFATEGLSNTDVLLAVISINPRDTELHAGLCIEGQWTWLR